jgi:hypothetical protein
LAHLHLTLGYFEEMEHLLIEVSFLLMVISWCVVLGYNVSMGIIIDSLFVFLYMDYNNTKMLITGNWSVAFWGMHMKKLLESLELYILNCWWTIY